MQKKSLNICIFQKKAVPLHPLTKKRKIYRGVEQW